MKTRILFSAILLLAFMPAFSQLVTDRLDQTESAFVEPYGEWVSFGGILLNVDTGLTYLLSNNMQLDASFGIGVTEQMHFFSFGFSWNIPRK